MGKNEIIQIKRLSVIFVCALSIVTLVLSGCNSLDNGYTEVIDADGDGWSDIQEERAGTNPNEPDTDGDGYWDPKDANPLDPNIPSITQPAPAPVPAPDETEAAETELSNIQTAVVAPMVDNRLSTLPNPVGVATSDMNAFPDATSAITVDKVNDLNGTAYGAGDNDGFILYGHDIIADSANGSLVNYVATRYTKGTYTVTATGTVTQVTYLTMVPAPVPTPVPIPAPTGSPVTFPDPNLEAAIREAIGKSEGPIRTTDLASLTSFEPTNENISNLSGLEYCLNLTRLSLHQNQISAISPLSSLSNLTELFLSSNQISDISPLSSLTNLTSLYLGQNQISDVSPLSTLVGLEYLALSQNQVSDVSPLSSLDNIKVFWLNHNQITDISPLTRITDMVQLGLEQNPLSANSVNVLIPQLIAKGVHVLYD